MTPSSNGSRSPSRAAGGNSPSSSTKSTPPWLRLISPGRSVADPPPIRPTVDVVWCGARNGGVEIRPLRRQRQSGGGVDHRDGQRLGPVERREQARQSLGEHRLARPGRADHQQVVAAGGGDLQRPPGDRLAADVGEIGQRRCFGGGGRARIGRPRRLARQCLHDLGQRRRDVHVALGGHVRLRSGDGGDHDIDVAEHGDHRGDARHPAQRAVEAELAEEGQLLHHRLGHLAGCDEDADGDRQVEAGTDLAHPRRREVDRDAQVRPLEVRAHHGGPDAVARLAARAVGLADDAVAREALADVDLDGHRVAAGSEQAGGRDGSEHDGLPRHGWWIEGGAATGPTTEWAGRYRRGVAVAPDGNGPSIWAQIVSDSETDRAQRRIAPRLGS